MHKVCQLAEAAFRRAQILRSLAHLMFTRLQSRFVWTMYGQCMDMARFARPGQKEPCQVFRIGRRWRAKGGGVDAGLTLAASMAREGDNGAPRRAARLDKEKALTLARAGERRGSGLRLPRVRR